MLHNIYASRLTLSRPNTRWPSNEICHYLNATPTEMWGITIRRPGGPLVGVTQAMQLQAIQKYFDCMNRKPYCTRPRHVTSLLCHARKLALTPKLILDASHALDEMHLEHINGKGCLFQAHLQMQRCRISI